MNQDLEERHCTDSIRVISNLIYDQVIDKSSTEDLFKKDPKVVSTMF